jgi:hypothetical protein
MLGDVHSLLRRLKRIADEHAGEFESEGFRRFFAMIQQELTEDYFTVVEAHLKALKFKHGCSDQRRAGEWQ